MQRVVSLVAALLLFPTALQIPNAFGDRSGTIPVPAVMQGKGVLRVRAVTLTSGVFDDKGAGNLAAQKKAKKDAAVRVHMNFFPNLKIDVDWNKVEKVQSPAGLAWTGRTTGPTPGSATLIISGKNVTGNIAGADSRMYQIRTIADGSMWVREVDQKTFPREGASKSPDLNEQ